MPFAWMRVTVQGTRYARYKGSRNSHFSTDLRLGYCSREWHSERLAFTVFLSRCFESCTISALRLLVFTIARESEVLVSG